MKALSESKHARCAETAEDAGGVAPAIESPPMPSQDIGDQRGANDTCQHPHPDTFNGIGLRADGNADDDDQHGGNVTDAYESLDGHLRFGGLHHVAYHHG